MSKTAYHEIKDPARFESVVVQSESQRDQIGQILADVISQRRGFEITQVDEAGPIRILTTAADDLGHVWEIPVVGKARDVGTTEKSLSERK
jgi:hypothetical protein